MYEMILCFKTQEDCVKFLAAIDRKCLITIATKSPKLYFLDIYPILDSVWKEHYSSKNYSFSVFLNEQINLFKKERSIPLDLPFSSFSVCIKWEKIDGIISFFLKLKKEDLYILDRISVDNENSQVSGTFKFLISKTDADGFCHIRAILRPDDTFF